MKLHSLYESGLSPEQRAELHKSISRDRSDQERWVIEVIRAHLLDGTTIIKEVLKTGSINMDDIIDAIKSKRCIPAQHQDIGHTYLKNQIGNAIRKEFSARNKYGTTVNDARRIFGLPDVRRKSD